MYLFPLLVLFLLSLTDGYYLDCWTMIVLEIKEKTQFVMSVRAKAST